MRLILRRDVCLVHEFLGSLCAVFRGDQSQKFVFSLPLNGGDFDTKNNWPSEFLGLFGSGARVFGSWDCPFLTELFFKAPAGW